MTGCAHLYSHFRLPSAILKRLFRGDQGTEESIISRNDSLWSEFVGLASAVAYLHESSHTAHRDIKPSNVLVYVDERTGALDMKLTDFGLSIGLGDASTWQEGSADQRSALVYDAPEVRSIYLTSKEGKKQLVPTPKQLLSYDVWKLGCVLTELSFFIVGGSEGVTRFRESIVTEHHNVVTDSFGDLRPTGPHFDDGERVKPQVLDSVQGLAQESHYVDQIQSILCAMLGESSTRPTARVVAQDLDKVTVTPHPKFRHCRLVQMARIESTNS
ncbi:serine/threonine protein kinase [Colletotrichum plurivorum]|uniref:Serine/threonine protein kinase n=1 Tax=Colletotrichum plurivorum TaxID=2175906 RepID=A0A8H6JUW8_9PEZI|nr:serine/threonine protein kinase [Colletotrichum plurivorum]